MDSRRHTSYHKALLSPRQYSHQDRFDHPLSSPPPPPRPQPLPYRHNKRWWQGLDYVGRTLPDILSPVKKIFNMEE